ncbi:MAG: DUF1929 domain-containing protein [Actinomycetota bacterium]|nr:DUF1929 domain-containing protein [Actinomycetota bacterium]
MRSFTAFARRRSWLTADPASVLERRSEPADRTRAIDAASLERLFRREDVQVREKCLWRLLYETAARAPRSPQRRRDGPRPGEQAPGRSALPPSRGGERVEGRAIERRDRHGAVLGSEPVDRLRVGTLTLVRCGAVTHNFHMDQRSMSGSTFTAGLPTR